MKLILKKSVLLPALEFVKISIPKKTTSPILKMIFIQAEGDTLTFRTAARFSEATLTLKGVEIEEAGVCCVDNILADSINLFDEGDINLSYNGKKFIVSQAKRKHQLNTGELEKFPNKLVVDSYREFDPTYLFSILKRLSLTIGTGQKKPFDESVYIHPHEKFVTTGNGTSVSLWQDVELPFNIAMPYGNMLVSALSTFAKKEQETFFCSFGAVNAFRIESEHVHREFIFSGYQGEYSHKGIDVIRSSLVAQPVVRIKSNKENLIKALSICKVFSDRAYEDNKIYYATLSVSKDKVAFGMKIKGIGEIHEDLECEVEASSDFSYDFHPGALLSAVQQCNGSIELNFYKPLAPFILKDTEVNNYTYLQVAMSLPKEAPKKGTKDASSEN